jgi:hypothetical protein
MRNSMNAKIRGLLYYIFKEDYVTYYIERSTYWNTFDTTDLSKEQILLLKKIAKELITEMFEKGKNPNNSFSFVKYIESQKDFWKKN